jgi:Na+/melibiose symporter-like transporter
MNDKGNGAIAAPPTANGFEMSRAERLSYSSFFLGQNIFYYIIVGFFGVYLLEVGLNPIWVGIIMLVPKIWDAVNDPILGIIIDKISIRDNKYIPWIRMAVFFTPIITVFMFFIPVSLDLWARAVWAITGFVLWSTAYSLGDVPAYALITATTSNNDERAAVQSWSRLFASVGIAFTYLALPQLYPKIGWGISIIIVAALAALTMIPVCFKARERIKFSKADAPSFGDIFHQLALNKYLFVYVGGNLIGGIFNAITIITPIFCTYLLGDAGVATYMSAAMLVPTLIVAPFVGKMLKKIDKKALFNISSLLSLIIGIPMAFLNYSDITLIVIFCFIRGLAGAPAGILCFQFTPDCVEYGTYKTGKRAESVTFSLQTFIANLSGALSSALIMFAIGLAGFNKDLGIAQPNYAQIMIVGFLTWIPAIGILAQVLLMTFLYKLTDSDVSTMIKYNNAQISREECDGRLSFLKKR